MSAADTTPGMPENALRELELSTLTLADRARVELVRRALVDLRAALADEKIDHHLTMKRWAEVSDRKARAIAKARKLLREGGVGTTACGRTDRLVYAALDWRQR